MGKQKAIPNLFYVKTNAGSGANFAGGMIYYIWTAIEGFSAFGSYESNARRWPVCLYRFCSKFIYQKSAVTAYDWFIYDFERDTAETRLARSGS